MSAFVQLGQMAYNETVGFFTGYAEDRQNAKNAQRMAEYARQQAKYANDQAAVAQLQGEQEAAKRSRQLAYDIGSTYANYAGNGLMVDGAGKDSLGDVLKTTVTEADADIKTIRDNTTMNIWTHMREKALYDADARGYSAVASNSNGRIKARNMSFLAGPFWNPTVGNLSATAYSLNHPTTYKGFKA